MCKVDVKMTDGGIISIHTDGSISKGDAVFMDSNGCVTTHIKPGEIVSFFGTAIHPIYENLGKMGMTNGI